MLTLKKTRIFKIQGQPAIATGSGGWGRSTTVYNAELGSLIERLELFFSENGGLELLYVS